MTVLRKKFIRPSTQTTEPRTRSSVIPSSSSPPVGTNMDTPIGAHSAKNRTRSKAEYLRRKSRQAIP